MDALVRNLMKDGMAISEIMNMPFTYIVDILKEKNHRTGLSEKEQEAILDAL